MLSPHRRPYHLAVVSSSRFFTQLTSASPDPISHPNAPGQAITTLWRLGYSASLKTRPRASGCEMGHKADPPRCRLDIALTSPPSCRSLIAVLPSQPSPHPPPTHLHCPLAISRTYETAPSVVTQCRTFPDPPYIIYKKRKRKRPPRGVSYTPTQKFQVCGIIHFARVGGVPKRITKHTCSVTGREVGHVGGAGLRATVLCEPTRPV